MIRARAIFARCLAISGGMLTISGALAAVDGSLLGGRLIEVVVRHGLVSVKRGTVAILGRLISIRGPLLGRRLRPIAIDGIVVAVSRGALTVIGGVNSIRGSLVRIDTCPVTVRCRPHKTVGGRPLLLERLLFGRRLVDVAYGRLRVAFRGGMLALISGFASPVRLLISDRLGPVAF
jgi:hypothetical protein